MKTFLQKQNLNFSPKALLIVLAGVFILNSSKAQTYVNGGIFSNTTWTLANSPYVVLDTVKIFGGVTLTIQPGVVVKFDTNAMIYNLGTLNAIGTATDSIIFTANSPTAGISFWNEIWNGTNFKYCRISNSTWGLNVPTTNVTHCTFTSNYYGMWGTNYGVDSCVFRNNSTGLRTGTFVTNSQFLYCGIGDNATDSIYNCAFTHCTYGSYFAAGPVSHCILDSNSTAVYYGNVNNSTLQYNGTAILGGNKITSNIITYNNIGINSIRTNFTISLNDISYDTIGIQTDGDNFSCNTFTHNILYNVQLMGSLNADARGNYWNLPDSAHIQATIYDAYQNYNLGLVIFTPYDTVPCNNNYFCSNNYVQDICIVTTDTAINKNVIIWGRNNSPAHGSWNIYDSTGSGWVRIGSVSDTALSEFIDTASHPNLQAYSYRITTVDSCGESAPSPLNTSIYLQVAQLPGRDSLYWSQYIGFATPHYLIYRGPSLNALTLLDSVTGSQLYYVDSLPPAGSMYLIKAVNPGGPCVPTHSRNLFIVSADATLSNGGIPKIPSGVYNISFAGNVRIYPNPNNGVFQLGIRNYQLGIKYQTEVYNMLGERVYTGTLNAANTTLDLSNNASGVYLYRIQTETGSLVSEGKFVIQ